MTNFAWSRAKAFRQIPAKQSVHPLPHRVAVQVTLPKHGIRAHGGLDRRVLAVTLHEHLAGAVDILIDTDPTALSDDAEGGPEHGMGVFCVFIFHQCHH